MITYYNGIAFEQWEIQFFNENHYQKIDKPDGTIILSSPERNTEVTLENNKPIKSFHFGTCQNFTTYYKNIKLLILDIIQRNHLKYNIDKL